MKLEMCTPRTIFDQICLKAIKNYFFPMFGLQSREGQGEA